MCESIRERNYRLKKKNYLSGPIQELDVNLQSSGLVLISGANGAGKSTLLDAISELVCKERTRPAPLQSECTRSTLDLHLPEWRT